jgi:preprotein translocase subunit SecA
MLLAYDAELDNLAEQLPARVRERCELAEMTYEGAVMEAREAGQTLPVAQVAKEMLEAAGVAVQLTREQLENLTMDNLREQMAARIQRALGADILGEARRRIETRTRLELQLELPEWEKLDWDDWREHVLEALAKAQDHRIEQHIGEIEQLLQEHLTHPERMTRSDWGRLILDLAYSRDVSFHEKTRQRMVRMEQRFPYVYHAAELLQGENAETLSERVVIHLQRASEILRLTWGHAELQRLQAQRPDDLDEKTATLLRAEHGEVQYSAIKGQQLGSLTGAEREQVRKALGRGIVIEVYRQLLLSISSQLWVDYLTSMEALRTSVGLEAYAQRDPLIAYKSRAYDLFRQLLLDMRTSLVTRMFTSSPTELTGVRADGRAEEEKVVDKTPGRNDPCWCGSGKKFKNCHMRRSGKNIVRPRGVSTAVTTKKKRKKKRARR